MCNGEIPREPTSPNENKQIKNRDIQLHVDMMDLCLSPIAFRQILFLPEEEISNSFRISKFSSFQFAEWYGLAKHLEGLIDLIR